MARSLISLFYFMLILIFEHLAFCAVAVYLCAACILLKCVTDVIKHMGFVWF